MTDVPPETTPSLQVPDEPASVVPPSIEPEPTPAPEPAPAPEPEPAPEPDVDPGYAQKAALYDKIANDPELVDTINSVLDRRRGRQALIRLARKAFRTTILVLPRSPMRSRSSSGRCKS